MIPERESYLGYHHLASIIYTIVRFEPKTPITIIKARAHRLPFLATQKRRKPHACASNFHQLHFRFSATELNAPNGRGPYEYEYQLNTSAFSALNEHL